MIVALAADHVGMPFKAVLATILRARGDVVRDLGTNDTLPVDYPEYAYAVGIAVASRRAERGIVVCGGSIGACMAANKIAGVRCVAPLDLLGTEQSRRHHDANVIALDAYASGWQTIERLAISFLLTPFDRGRHVVRVAKISHYGDELRHRLESALASEMPIDAPSRLPLERGRDERL